jgi:predicted O-linked N-acetylglucosamine transferase (SPINDLY family)
LSRLEAAEADGVPRGQVEGPLANVTRCDEPARNLVIAQRAAQHISMRYRPQFAARRRTAVAGERITVGYMSSDIHNHAIAHLMRGVFQGHDHERFRIHTYSYGADDGSHYRAEVRAASDVFRDIRALSHRAAAEQIAADGVDILVDLKGWTEGIRFEICALRPAPLQMTYLGFPGTCGADFIDYAIVDATVVPPVEARNYSEQLIYLPHCYQATDDQQPMASEVCRRGDFGLPEEAIVLCSFNQSYKLDPVMFAAWMRILQRVPQAVLWLFAGNRWAEDNLRQAAQEHGVAAARLVFAAGLPKPQHLRRLQLVDVALDTRIYNGHTTTSDALWAGVPVVTLMGRHFASRVSASCLEAIGMPELVTHTLAQYEELAVALANECERVAELKSKLARNRGHEPLFDTRRFTRNLERAYQQAWENYLGGKPAQSFKVLE